MNKKNLIKNVLLIGGVAVLTVGMLTGCGKKNDETKTYDKENEVTQSITNNVNYAEKLSTEEKINIAYALHDFDSASQISKDKIVSAMFGVLDEKTTREDSVIALYKEDFDEMEIKTGDTSYKIYEYNENDVKKAAKDLLNVDITEPVTNFGFLDNLVKYNNGKYYYLTMPAAGEELTIKNISNDGNKYTFFALKCLDSEEQDISEYTKYEAVIENGVIKSCKEAMNTENKTKDSSQSSTNKNGVDTANEAIRKVLKNTDWYGRSTASRDGIDKKYVKTYFAKLTIDGKNVYLVDTINDMADAHTLTAVSYENGEVVMSVNPIKTEYEDIVVDFQKKVIATIGDAEGEVALYTIQRNEFVKFAYTVYNPNDGNVDCYVNDTKVTEESFSSHIDMDNSKQIGTELTNENIDKYVK